MKNSEIHNGLEKQEIRDFLSIQLVKLWDEEMENKKPTLPYSRLEDDPFEWSIKDAEAEIEMHKMRLVILKQKQAIVRLIAMNGWKEFDVSDQVEKDMPYKLKMNFIGTDEEYKILQPKLK